MRRTGRHFFDGKDGDKKEEKRESRSDDGFIMPRSPEEEQAYQATLKGEGETKEKYWRSEFDDLPIEEQFTDWTTQTAIWSIIIPISIGAYVLVTQMPKDEIPTA